MCSTRVAGTESINGENLRGQHLSDGATYVYRRGDEYEDIFPVWDWHRLPGVTTYAEGPMTWFDRKREGSHFVGEVSDGRYGAAAMELRRDGLTARKAWFFLDDGFVCLGAGLHADQDRAVETTLNQCLLNGEVRVAAGGQTTTLAPGTRQHLDHPRWMYHDGIGYLFLQPAEATVSNQEQSGSWKSVIATEPGDPVTRRVFSLSIEHSRQPRDASYAYMILPGTDPERLAADARRPEVRIMSNTPALQAVRNEVLKLTQAVFYQPGQVDLGDGRTAAVDRPCLLMGERSGDVLKLSVADPTQQLDRVQIELSGHFTGEGCRYDPSCGKSIVTFALPAGGDAGKSVVRSLRSEG
jgi:chondroitin AC lyase